MQYQNVLSLRYHYCRRRSKCQNMTNSAYFYVPPSSRSFACPFRKSKPFLASLCPAAPITTSNGGQMADILKLRAGSAQAFWPEILI